MKKYLMCFILVVCMVVGLAVPTLAVQQMYDFNGEIAESPDNVWDKSIYTNAVVIKQLSGIRLYLTNGQLGHGWESAGNNFHTVGATKSQVYKAVDGVWTLERSLSGFSTVVDDSKPVVWSSSDIYKMNLNELTSTVYFKANELKLAGVDFEDWADYYGALTNQITVKNVVAVVAVGVTAVIGIVFLWWGVRKVVRAIMTAFRKGRVSL